MATLSNTIRGLSGLQSFWLGNDAGSPLVPDQGAIFLTATGSTITYQNPALTAVPSEKSIEVDGLGFFTGGDNYDFPGTAAYTYGILINPSVFTASVFYGLGSKWDNTGPNGWQLWLNNNAGTLRISHERNTASGVQGSTLNSPSGLAIGTTCLCIACEDGTNTIVYLNNNKNSVGNNSSSLPNTTTNFQVVQGGNTAGFRGFWSHAFVLNRAILDAEVAALVSSISVAPSATSLALTGVGI